MMPQRSALETISLRLQPGTDLRHELAAIARQEGISAGIILSAVGSLSPVHLRFAGSDVSTQLMGKHEILTLSGTLSVGGIHLHLMVANAQGECIGGHVVTGALIYTTLELVIGVLPDVCFQRVWDEETGFKELAIVPQVPFHEVT